MFELKNPKVAVPVVLFAGLIWSFGPLVVRYMDDPQLIPWQYIFGLNEEKPFKAILKRNFFKKKNFTRFAKSKLNTTKNGKIEVEVLQGQESFRIKSFVKSNIWALLPSGKSNFKKGEIVDCFFPNQSNSTLL